MRRRTVLFFPLAIQAICLPAGSFASGGSRGPFTPVIARQKLSYISVDFQGKEKILYEYVGEYLRSSDGSELATLGLPLQVATPDQFGNLPTVLPNEGRLRIGREGITYKLDYKKRIATMMTKQQLPLMPHNSDTRRDVSGDKLLHEKIEGRNCLVMPVITHGDETGTAFREPKTDILMRLTSFFGSREDQVRVVLQRYDVSTKQEPDESFFAIPAKWTVIWPSTAEAPADATAAPAPAKPDHPR